MPFKAETHKPKGWKPPEQRKKEHDQARGTASQRGYDSRWNKARKSFLENNPLCVRCKAEGVIKAANVVDHITPHRGDQGLFWSLANWQALCKKCHDTKTAKEDGAFKGRGRQKPDA